MYSRNNVDAIESVATCSANRYSLETVCHAIPYILILNSFLISHDILYMTSIRPPFQQFGTPTLECDEFVRVEDCEENDNLIPVVTPENGGCAVDEPTKYPTPSPTNVPIKSPTPPVRS